MHPGNAVDSFSRLNNMNVREGPDFQSGASRYEQVDSIHPATKGASASGESPFHGLNACGDCLQCRPRIERNLIDCMR